MSEHSKGGHVTGLVKYLVYGFFILFALFLFASGFPWLLELPFRLLCGWALHGWKALPQFLAKWDAALLPAGCLVLAGILLHRFILRWAVAKRPSLVWRAGHTVAVLSLVLLGSAAAISASGVMHQFFWLGGGKVIENRGRNVELVIAMNNGRQLMLFLLEYFEKNGRYAQSFEELETEFGNDYGFSRELWWVGTRGGDVAEPWVLLRPGSTVIALDEDPLIVSPLLQAGTKRVVGFADGSVRTVTAKGFSKMIQAGGKEGRTDE